MFIDFREGGIHLLLLVHTRAMMSDEAVCPRPMREAPRLDGVRGVLTLGVLSRQPGEVREVREGEDLDLILVHLIHFVHLSLLPRPALAPLGSELASTRVWVTRGMPPRLDDARG